MFKFDGFRYRFKDELKKVLKPIQPPNIIVKKPSTTVKPFKITQVKVCRKTILLIDSSVGGNFPKNPKFEHNSHFIPKFVFVNFLTAILRF